MAWRTLTSSLLAPCILLVLLTIGCDQNRALVSADDPHESGRRVQPGAWSDPFPIELEGLTASEIIQSSAVSLEFIQGQLVLVVRAPDDSTTFPARRHKLVRFTSDDGLSWHKVAELRRASTFQRVETHPTLIPSISFWPGEPDNEVPPLPLPDSYDEARSSTLYACQWMDDTCMNVDSLRFQLRSHMRFSEVVSHGGVHSVFVTYIGAVAQVQLTGQSLTVQNIFNGILTSSIVTSTGRMIVAYGDPEGRPRGFGLSIRTSEDGLTLSSAHRIFDEDDITVQNTKLLETSDGTIHVVWMGVVSTDGTNILWHAMSNDYGVTWTQPKEVARDPSLFHLRPTLFEDRNGFLHAAWAHHRTPPDRVFFHAVFMDSTWSEREEPFAQMKMVAFPTYVSGDNGQFHMVWRSDEQLWYSTFMASR